MATRGETEGSSSSPELSTKLSFEFLEDITNNFSQIFCEDSYGTVYKGTLPDSNKEIAVKKLKQKEEIAPDNFENQLQSIVGLKHENIVEVFGFCNETLQNSTERLLCYGFSPSENLEQHLFDTGTEETEHSSSTEPSTNWDTCFKIIKGICQGLLFLHKQLDNNPITHMDLNLKNIWLDKAMVPKIANVELSKIISQEQIRKESCGYLAPECLNDTPSDMSFQTDIYSLGVMIIQITTGEKSQGKMNDRASRGYIDKIRRNWTAEHIASKYSSFDSECLHQVHACIKIGLECVQIDQKNRPSIEEIVDRLNTI
ncbi:putative receptor-like protein kinase At4g00960 isoform X1 [Hordeum vulgare subsp. vulgare]|uniref:Predicted protein n=1 Tax=Hordeum vulgare subsp. vulgare TaxID=112509 RepID=F2E272_HORVV|nr:putative receptor-like protein kinase At4g00960 isoform X1 [Hordeum vulgare subsp. vulgare]XP_044961016.1 putative receptor-like protein kinase At4g00960 isoform X1 [Hordeum vulgare subsp. vulgare]BAK01444.1 predicted protein [Hordeum vulgare subsp. vulgare]